MKVYSVSFKVNKIQRDLSIATLKVAEETSLGTEEKSP